MLYDLKLNREELFMPKTKGLVLLYTFYMVKKIEKLFKWKSLSVKEGGGGEIY